MDNVLVVDCQTAGISGDMFLSALVDLGADGKLISKAVAGSKDYLKGCNRIKVEFKEVTRMGLRAKLLNQEIKERTKSRPAGEIEAAIVRRTLDLGLGKAAQDYAKRAIGILVTTEANLHGHPKDRAHLHEAGSADTLIDIVGSAVALDQLGVLGAEAYCTPVAVGGGLHTFSHGTLSIPAPATLAILKKHKIGIMGGPVAGELTTPTGAALLAALAPKCVDFYPALKPIAVGYGAGTKNLGGVPNMTRIVLGESEPPHLSDKVFLLETNVDDASGEVLGYALQRLLDAGALDASFVPMYTKKNRPGCLVRVVSDGQSVNRMVDLLMSECGTLGVRISPVMRHIAQREFQTIKLRWGDKVSTVRVKVARDRFGRVLQAKPEFVDIERLAKKMSAPLKDISAQVSDKARQLFSEQKDNLEDAPT